MVQTETDRILAVSFVLNNEDFVLVNIYGPNNEANKCSFFQDLEEVIESFPPTYNILVAGDFNVVLDNNLDIIAGGQHNDQYVKRFNEFLCKADLYDAWRIFHGQEKQFSWSSNSSPWKARRLDYVLVNSVLFNKVIASEMFPVPNTDHCGVEIELHLHAIKRGPSYWKFNKSLLKHHDYVDMINEKINSCKAALEGFSDQMKWDYCKRVIRDSSILYSKQKAVARKNEINILRKKLKDLQSELGNNPDPLDERLLNEMKDTKLALNLCTLHEAQGAQTRARIKWIEEGERNTKYFLGLEKFNSNSKYMVALKNPQGETCTTQEGIMQIQVEYFQNLYKEKIDFEQNRELFDEFCCDITTPKLSEAKQALCEGLVTTDEAGCALSKMNNDSAPGIDGLTASFYKFFWINIKDMVMASFNEAFQNGKLSVSQRRAVITLIHKDKNLTKDELNNWRPISLTNTDYKILAKALAFRVQGVISELIFEDQVGYIKGRNISTIIRLIDDVIEYIRVNNKSGVIVALDYSKAFDSINKKFLIETFNLAGFGPDFIQLVKTITNGTESCINYFGWLSEFFPVECGIRQGCPFSPLAFILGVELLAHKIRQAPNITGIHLPFYRVEKIAKVALYADDNTLLLNNLDDVNNALEVVDQFSRFTGLRLNKNKTKAMQVGKPSYSQTTINNISWAQEGDLMKILGIYFNDKGCSNVQQNWDERIETIIRYIKMWEKRNLSIIGKIQVIKTFLMSQMVYLMQAIILPEDILKKINTILFKFLWKRRFSNRRAFEKVKRDVVCQDYVNGGVKMINIIDMQNSFVIQWFRRLYMNKDAFFSVLPMSYFGKLGLDLSVLHSSVKSKEFIGLDMIKSHFWKKALKVWLDYNGQMSEIQHIANQPIWNNDMIKYKNRPLMFTNWINAGYIFVGDLFIDDNLVTLDYICANLGPDANLIFQYNAVYNSLSADWRNPAVVGNFGEVTANFRGQDLPQVTTKFVRDSLVQSRAKPPCCINFWTRRFPLFDVSNTFLTAINATKEIRLRVLHWKITHNIYPTNILLHKMGLSNTENCNLCEEKDYIEHFFCECPRVNRLWKRVELEVSEVLGGEIIQLTTRQKLFGVVRGDLSNYFINKVNHLILVAKMCISKYVYGDYNDIIRLFEYELALRKECDHWLIYASQVVMYGCM